jgi:DNA-binding MarR family transcriptional regulator
MISPGFVPWQEVQRIEERAFRRRVFVAITVTDREALRARQSAWHRLLLRINGPMAAGDILIPDNALPMSPAALVKTMRRLHRAAQRRTRS